MEKFLIEKCEHDVFIKYVEIMNNFVTSQYLNHDNISLMNSVKCLRIT